MTGPGRTPGSPLRRSQETQRAIFAGACGAGRSALAHADDGTPVRWPACFALSARTHARQLPAATDGGRAKFKAGTATRDIPRAAPRLHTHAQAPPTPPSVALSPARRSSVPGTGRGSRACGAARSGPLARLRGARERRVPARTGPPLPSAARPLSVPRDPSAWGHADVAADVRACVVASAIRARSASCEAGHVDQGARLAARAQASVARKLGRDLREPSWPARVPSCPSSSPWPRRAVSWVRSRLDPRHRIRSVAGSCRADIQQNILEQA